jgi:hypothetical protein
LRLTLPLPHFRQRKRFGPRETLLKSAAGCWIPVEALQEFLNGMPGPALTKTDVAQRLRAFEDEGYSYPMTFAAPTAKWEARFQMNAINVIAPYKYHGQWVFDDPRVGLSQEPFVAGADTWIDRVVADIPDAERGFTLIFSGASFPGHQYRLDWRREEGAETGIIPPTSIWKGGCVRLSLNISRRLPKLFMRRSKREARPIKRSYWR